MSSHIKNRQSNLELLRIFAMVVIVASHYAAHGIEMVSVEENAWVIWRAGSFINRAFVALMNPGGEVGVAVLFMLTGYFLIHKKQSSLKKVFLTCIYYSLFSLLVLAFVSLLGGSIPYMSGQSLLAFVARSLFMPLTSTLWWFVAVYVYLVLFSPIINAFLNKLNRKGFIAFLFVCWAIWYGLAFLIDTEFFELQKAVFFYSLGAFLRLYMKPATQNRWRFAITAFLSWSVAGFCFYQLGMNYLSGGAIKGPWLSMVYSAVLSLVMVPLCVWALFRFFEGWQIAENAWINRIAATTFGVYLIHDSLIIRPLLWYAWLGVAKRQYPSPLFPLYAVATVFLIFLTCSALDMMRIRFYEPFAEKTAETIFSKMKRLFLKK